MSNEILMYGGIGTEITDKQFSKNLNLYKDQDVLLRANSPGGDYFQSLTIYNLIKEHGKCDVQIDGLAASGMTVVMLGARKISAAKNAMIMIHGPSYPDPEHKMTKSDEALFDKIRNILVNNYSQRTGISAEELLKMLSTDTWMTADEALEKGFIDEITDEVLQNLPVNNIQNLKPKTVYLSYKTGIIKPKSLTTILGLKENSDAGVILQAISSMKNRLVSKESELTRIKNKIKDEQDSEAKRLTSLAIESGVINKNLETVHLLAFSTDFKKTKRDLENAINEVQGSQIQLRNHNLIKEVILKGKNSNLVKVNDVTVGDKPKSEWTLTDYRKYAPKELETDPELYKKLVKEEYKK